MSARYYGANYGQNSVTAVVEGSSTNSTDIEAVVTYTASNNSKTATILALEAIIDYISQHNWPPA